MIKQIRIRGGKSWGVDGLQVAFYHYSPDAHKVERIKTIDHVTHASMVRLDRLIGGLTPLFLNMGNYIVAIYEVV